MPGDLSVLRHAGKLRALVGQGNRRRCEWVLAEHRHRRFLGGRGARRLSHFHQSRVEQRHQFPFEGMRYDRMITVKSTQDGAKHDIYLYTLPFDAVSNAAPTTPCSF